MSEIELQCGVCGQPIPAGEAVQQQVPPILDAMMYVRNVHKLCETPVDVEAVLESANQADPALVTKFEHKLEEQAAFAAQAEAEVSDVQD